MQRRNKAIQSLAGFFTEGFESGVLVNGQVFEAESERKLIEQLTCRSIGYSEET
jgi:hypothetical protein